MSRPKALVTGASSGIGAALAIVLADAGYDLVLIARRRDRLEEVAARADARGATSEVVVLDLADGSDLGLAVERAAAGDLDLVVSNAGVSAYGPFAELAMEELERSWTLNADLTPRLVRAALPAMTERRSGGFILVASALAFSGGISTTPSGFPLPQRALYVAAKAGMLGFGRVLGTELAGTGVGVTVVCPGMVSSEWNGGKSRVPGAMTPEDVARAAWRGFEMNERVCLPGVDDLGLIDQLLDAERAIFLGNTRGALAERYV